MIATVTFNPSLDYVISVDSFILGALNRTNTEKIFPGGKGINVSIVLHALGIDTIAYGFEAGFTGTALTHLLHQRRIQADFIQVANGFTRINVKIRTANTESEINGRGPEIDKKDIELLYAKLDLLSEADCLVLAGSIPPMVPQTIYEDILCHLQGKKIKTIVDATNHLLLNVLPYHPFLIKPNDIELGEIFGVKISGIADSITYGKKLQDSGAKNVLVSLGKKGAILIDEFGTVHQCDAPKGKVLNTIGAGDSMVAGFLAGYLKTGDYKQALRMGVCAGSASAFSYDLASRQDIETLLCNMNQQSPVNDGKMLF
ncbi:1-phosphofructokinase [Sphaerochaeta pleomorpha str. Grapes]|uniref:1-phosphofructokinase n=1 Tax=Sphaerochaeta pleomorpha (strain ATCC BAA-1885 / DSM 22778 / Grapes) TaxID=158190 RepID=G8QVB8_SPHPG|nr:1-phosphofructokinase [Sphaerochaeta pleomorpha]AEV30433.1 1-phosphofructokinase [Sphaerochaeta pleomorpha str. Grapes]